MGAAGGREVVTTTATTKEKKVQRTKLNTATSGRVMSVPRNETTVSLSVLWGIVFLIRGSFSLLEILGYESGSPSTDVKRTLSELK